MRAILVILLAAATLASGCVGNAASADGDEKSREAATVTATRASHHPPSMVGYAGCSEVDIAFPLSASHLPDLPEGFAPVPFLGDPTGELATVLVWSTACREGHASGHHLQAPAEVWAFLPVTVPEEHQRDDLDGHLVALGAIVQEEAAAKTYTSWGMPEGAVVLGSVGVATLGAADSPVRAATADADAGNFSVSIRASAEGLTSTNGGGRVRAYIVEEGHLKAAFDNVWSTYVAPTLPGPATASIAAPAPATGLHVPVESAAGFGMVLSGIAYTNQFVPLHRDMAVKEKHDGAAAAPAIKGLQL
jgi:hypothetical protein